MTDESRKAASRERMRLYRLRHTNDPVYKARVREEKRKQLAKNPERRKANSRRRQKRYHEKHKHDPAYKMKAVALTAAWREKNPERAAAARDNWTKRNRIKVLNYYRDWHLKNRREIPKELVCFYAAARRARKKAAQPPWADEAAIETFYLAAKNMTEATGVVWHVDHIVPLKHKLVCGLHAETNLQLLPAFDNISKNNHFTP